MAYDLKLETIFDKALANQKKFFQEKKKSLDPFGGLMLYRLILSLPFTLPRMVQDMFTADTTLVYANVHMSRVPMKFNGVSQR